MPRSIALKRYSVHTIGPVMVVRLVIQRHIRAFRRALYLKPKGTTGDYRVPAYTLCEFGNLGQNLRTKLDNFLLFHGTVIFNIFSHTRKLFLVEGNR